MSNGHLHFGSKLIHGHRGHTLTLLELLITY